MPVKNLFRFISFKTPLLGVPLQPQPNAISKNLGMTGVLPVLPAMEAERDMVYITLLKNYNASNSVENFLEDLINMTYNSKFDANEFDTKSCSEFKLMHDHKMSKKEEETFMKNLRSSQKCRPSPYILILPPFYPDSVLILS